MQNLRFAIRALRASPVVTVVAVASLALGIGANTAIFALVNSVLRRSLPVVDPERLAMVATSVSPGARQQQSYATFDHIHRYGDIFDGALAYTDCCARSSAIGARAVDSNAANRREWPLPQYTFYIGVRSSAGDPESVSRGAGAALRAIDDGLALRFEPLSRQIDESLATDRMLAVLSGFFGAIALLLAGLGVYGLIAYSVARRRVEIGVRMAIGAAPADIVRMALSRASRLVGVGVLVGGSISMWASMFVALLLYGVGPRDPATLAASALALLAVGAIAGWLPAWRASRIDPAEALRQR